MHYGGSSNEDPFSVREVLGVPLDIAFWAFGAFLRPAENKHAGTTTAFGHLGRCYDRRKINTPEPQPLREFPFLLKAGMEKKNHKPRVSVPKRRKTANPRFCEKNVWGSKPPFWGLTGPLFLFLSPMRAKKISAPHKKSKTQAGQIGMKTRKFPT